MELGHCREFQPLYVSHRAEVKLTVLTKTEMGRSSAVSPKRAAGSDVVVPLSDVLKNQETVTCSHRG